MAYCTLAELIEQYGSPLLVEATDRGDVSTGEIDEVAVDRAISSADALIDGFLAPRYALPLVSTPDLVKALALPIALYKLHPAVAGEKVRLDYKDALDQLKQIGTGLLRLDVAGAEPAPSDGGGVLTNAPERPLTPSSMKGYI